MQSFWKSRWFIGLLSFGLFIMLCWGLSLWINYNPLKKYGITYIVDSGESPNLHWVTFYWDRNGKHIEGPTITADNLVVEFDHLNRGEIPRIKVSDLGGICYAVLKLNFSDPAKPEFELIECRHTEVIYARPWEKYYQKDPSHPWNEPRAEDIEKETRPPE